MRVKEIHGYCCCCWDVRASTSREDSWTVNDCVHQKIFWSNPEHQVAGPVHPKTMDRWMLVGPFRPANQMPPPCHGRASHEFPLLKWRVEVVMHHPPRAIDNAWIPRLTLLLLFHVPCRVVVVVSIRMPLSNTGLENRYCGHSPRQGVVEIGAKVGQIAVGPSFVPTHS